MFIHSFDNSRCIKIKFEFEILVSSVNKNLAIWNIYILFCIFVFTNLEYVYFVMLFNGKWNVCSNFENCLWKWIKISCTPWSFTLSVIQDAV